MKIASKAESLLGAVAMSIVLVGCCTAGHGKNWEYKIITNGNVRSYEAEINKAATEGWQLVDFYPMAENLPMAVMRRERR